MPGRTVSETCKMRVLVAVCRVHAATGRATLREVAAVAGYDSAMTVQYALRDLRDRGLVTWERGRHGTLRPLVREVPVDNRTSGL